MENETFYFEGEGLSASPDRSFVFADLMCEPSPENLTAILTCLGARISSQDLEFVANRQNPYRQRRGGLGFGAYSVVKIPGGGSTFTNINVFASEQAAVSPLEFRLNDPQSGDFSLQTLEGQPFTEGRLLSIPQWGSRRLSTGKPAITVLQQHGPANLVGLLGSSRCPLFETGDECRFCTLNGDSSNRDRSVQEILEAFEWAKSGRQAYNLTLSTGQFSEDEVPWMIEQVAALKRGVGSAALALEVTPFARNAEEIFRALKEAGLDTLMIPLDCATSAAQDRYVPGKARLLRENYWENVRGAVPIFGAGNVTSSLIVGLDPLPDSLRAIERMVEEGVVPEPIPVRWNDSVLVQNKLNGSYPLTNPNSLMEARRKIEILFKRRQLRDRFQKTLSGCAACGGCGGVVVNRLKSD